MEIVESVTICNRKCFITVSLNRRQFEIETLFLTVFHPYLPIIKSVLDFRQSVCVCSCLLIAK